mmetsp:Transcript_118007/g.235070  ORF Transcript_118007/g.235070 Transcript_118007/m.235070 type:complete len:84 (+) Transcript_118007:451-702(+)
MEFLMHTIHSRSGIQAVYYRDEPQAQQQHLMMPRRDGCKNTPVRAKALMAPASAITSATSDASSSWRQQSPVAEPSALPSDDA